jgi:hypothetical protein
MARFLSKTSFIIIQFCFRQYIIEIKVNVLFQDHVVKIIISLSFNSW